MHIVAVFRRSKHESVNQLLPNDGISAIREHREEGAEMACYAISCGVVVNPHDELKGYCGRCVACQAWFMSGCQMEYKQRQVTPVIVSQVDPATGKVQEHVIPHAIRTGALPYNLMTDVCGLWCLPVHIPHLCLHIAV